MDSVYQSSIVISNSEPADTVVFFKAIGESAREWKKTRWSAWSLMNHSQRQSHPCLILNAVPQRIEPMIYQLGHPTWILLLHEFYCWQRDLGKPPYDFGDAVHFPPHSEYAPLVKHLRAAQVAPGENPQPNQSLAAGMVHTDIFVLRCSHMSRYSQHATGSKPHHAICEHTYPRS